jgi:hypothetical protein
VRGCLDADRTAACRPHAEDVDLVDTSDGQWNAYPLASVRPEHLKWPTTVSFSATSSTISIVKSETQLEGTDPTPSEFREVALRFVRQARRHSADSRPRRPRDDQLLVHFCTHRLS